MKRRAKQTVKEIRTYTLQNVVSSEVMLNFKLRLHLACGHTTEVSSFKAGKQARCYKCGKMKNLEYEEG